MKSKGLIKKVDLQQIRQKATNQTHGMQCGANPQQQVYPLPKTGQPAFLKIFIHPPPHHPPHSCNFLHLPTPAIFSIKKKPKISIVYFFKTD